MQTYATTDDEQKARAIAERLWVMESRRAVVLEVRHMQNPPRTANRWAVLAEPITRERCRCVYPNKCFCPK